MFVARLDAYCGPADLLLYLVRRREVGAESVPVGELVGQYLGFVRALQLLDLDAAGEFLVAAATLLELKARALLPADVTEGGRPAPPAPPGDAPPRPLAEQLLLQRRYREVARALEAQGEAQQLRFRRVEPPNRGAGTGAIGAAPPPAVRGVEVWDLVAAFARLARESGLAPASVVRVEETPQTVHESAVLAAVAGGGRTTLRELFTPPHTRARLIGLFLAVLELVKRGTVGLELAADGDVEIGGAPPLGCEETSPPGPLSEAERGGPRGEP